LEAGIWTRSWQNAGLDAELAERWAGSWKLEAGSWKLKLKAGRGAVGLEVGSWKLQAGLEAGTWKLEAGSWKLEVGIRNLDAELTERWAGRGAGKTLGWKLEAGSCKLKLKAGRGAAGLEALVRGAGWTQSARPWR
jgi:hypothetical protein